MQRTKNIKSNSMEDRFLHILGRIVDVLTLALIVVIVVLIGRELFTLFAHTLWTGPISIAIDEVLYTLVLVELFTILFFYLHEHRIKVERIVEVGIISLVREIIFKVFDVSPLHLLAIGALLLVLGGLFFIEKYYSHARSMSR